MKPKTTQTVIKFTDEEMIIKVDIRPRELSQEEIDKLANNKSSDMTLEQFKECFKK